jgi:hypothetical protein
MTEDNSLQDNEERDNFTVAQKGHSSLFFFPAALWIITPLISRASNFEPRTSSYAAHFQLCRHLWRGLRRHLWRGLRRYLWRHLRRHLRRHLWRHLRRHLWRGYTFPAIFCRKIQLFRSEKEKIPNLTIVEKKNRRIEEKRICSQENIYNGNIVKIQ